jgi:MSHA biogenesis protein MshJ
VKRLDSAFARINRSSLRERALLFTAAVGLLGMLWNQLLMVPLAARLTALSHALQEAHARSSAAASGHAAEGLMDRYSALKLREAALRTALASTDDELNDAEAGMIAPKAMVAVLTDVLGHQKGLTLVLLRNLAVEPLLPPMAQSQGGSDAAAMGPYLHPVELVLRGNYLDVLAYLQELESRPWGFKWRRFEFNTSADGPEYRIEFTTLSMQSNWLGV